MHQNSFSAPGSTGGAGGAYELQPIVGWRVGCPFPIPLPPRRRGCLDLGAFCASIDSTAISFSTN